MREKLIATLDDND